MKLCYALAPLMLSTGSVQAATYVSIIEGRVERTFDTGFTTPGVSSVIRVGDVLRATFFFNDDSSVSAALGRSLNRQLGGEARFEIAGLTWTSAGDFLDGMNSPFSKSDRPLDGYFSIMDDAPEGGDLWIKEYEFEVGEFGYDLYEGPGFAGSFGLASLRSWKDGRLVTGPSASSSAVPESATWAMLIMGLGGIGGLLRLKRRNRATGQQSATRQAAYRHW